ncbi:MAG: 30S ribosomal protein S1 [candidate division Zixibacteria bacterium]|nr:30S ribosomal protein S1 [candidate division Zixibacteria bacterium]
MPEETTASSEAGKAERERPRAKTRTEYRMAPVFGDAEGFNSEEFEEQAGLYEESFRDIEENEIVTGTVVAITDDEVLVDIGYKSEGTINLGEFGEEESVAVGDRVEVYLEKKEDQDGVIVLSKEKADFYRAWDQVRDVYESGGDIEGRIISRVRGGFIVDIGVRAFLPASQLDLRPVRDFEPYIGENFRVKIIKVNKRRRNIVLSRKALLLEEREQKKKRLLETIKVGAVLEGEVKNITDFGAFVDLDGLDGLLHITDLSRGRVNHPSEVVSVGEQLRVLVTDFDADTGRVSLSLKELQEDPWDTVTERYREGDRVVGKVVSIVDYGAFVELEAGIEGLVHVSEMSWTQRVKHPSKVLSVGDEIGVVVLKIDEENKRISLGLRQTMPNPWDTIDERYPPGTAIKGVVKNITEFGVFVELEEGIDGLIHISDISWTKRVRHPSEFCQKGQTVEAVVLTIDSVNRRISLGVKQLERDPWATVEENYPSGTYVHGDVVRITPYGAIVKLEDDIEGLLHISEIAGRRINRVEDVLDAGDRIKVKVINITPKERRINLSLWQYQNETGDKGIEKGAGLAAVAVEEAKAAAAIIETPDVETSEEAAAEEAAPGREEGETKPEGARATETPPATAAPVEETAAAEEGVEGEPVTETDEAKEAEGVAAEKAAEPSGEKAETPAEAAPPEAPEAKAEETAAAEEGVEGEPVTETEEAEGVVAGKAAEPSGEKAETPAEAAPPEAPEAKAEKGKGRAKARGGKRKTEKETDG